MSNIGTERNHVYAHRRGEERRHWLLGDEWWAMLTLRGKFIGTVLKGWWHLGGSLTHHFELEVALGGEDSMLQFGIVIPWVVTWHIGVKVPRRFLNGWIYQRREWTLRCGYIGRWVEIMLASDEHMRDTGMVSYYRDKRRQGEKLSWSRAALWPGWHLTFNPRLRDRLLGRMDCVTETGEPFSVVVPLPEGNYPGECRREKRTWQRKRWPFSRRERVGYWIDMKIAPPVPGKGENSWDCDDDGVYGTGGATVAEAIANVTRAALRDRERYGSKNWTPSAGWPEGIAR